MENIRNVRVTNQCDIKTSDICISKSGGEKHRKRKGNGPLLASPEPSWAFVNLWAFLGFPALSWSLLGFPGLAWAFLGSLPARPGSPGRFCALLGSCGLSWARPGSSGLSRARLGSQPPLRGDLETSIDAQLLLRIGSRPNCSVLEC